MKPWILYSVTKDYEMGTEDIQIVKSFWTKGALLMWYKANKCRIQKWGFCTFRLRMF